MAGFIWACHTVQIGQVLLVSVRLGVEFLISMAPPDTTRNSPSKFLHHPGVGAPRRRHAGATFGDVEADFHRAFEALEDAAGARVEGIDFVFVMSAPPLKELAMRLKATMMRNITTTPTAE